jgi:archaellin
MQPRQAVERWRTRAVLAALALVAVAAVIATVVGQTSGSSSREPKAVRQAHIAPMGQNPLTVKGSGFRPGERVRLVVKGSQGAALTAKASPDGSFVAAFRGLNGCDSVTVSAAGSKGSRASFNLSQIACIAP